MNFEWDGKLAERQDRVIEALYAMKTPDPVDAEKLRGNRLVPIASILAPCNLSVRHYCLLDILDGAPKRLTKVNRLIGLLTNEFKGLWLEGHSYWGYTARILRYYAGTFTLVNLQMNINKMALWFNQTGYIGADGKHYPAPFGDIWRDNSLESQVTTMGASIPPVYWNSIHAKMVFINCKAVRFNLHTSFVHKEYDVSTGIPVDFFGGAFKFYKGYEEKYPYKWMEIWAIIKRAGELILNIFKEVP
jgi:hypothetical protein